MSSGEADAHLVSRLWHRSDCPEIWGYGCSCGGINAPQKETSSDYWYERYIEARYILKKWRDAALSDEAFTLADLVDETNEFLDGVVI